MSDAAIQSSAVHPVRADPGFFVREASNGGEVSLDLVVQAMHCAGCLRRVERNVGELPGIHSVRANLSTKRVVVRWDPTLLRASQIIDKIASIGFEAVPFDPKLIAMVDESEGRSLLRALGVAGFAAANVMLLSVAVWSGLVTDMEPETRALFYWMSALIALPAIAYAARPFYRSAYAALRKGQMNMDVPIALAVTLATGMSIVQTIVNARHVYFDASITLLFFLLIGRYLDVQARNRACSAAQNLLGLRAMAATLVEADGSHRSVPIESLEAGMMVAVAAGQRMPADGVIASGLSDVDTSLITGESLSDAVKVGTKVFAGTLNISAPLTLKVTARDENSLLSEIVRLMEAAEQGRSAYVRIADRAARIYAPSVHILALSTVVLWLIAGEGVVTAITNAIAVLIVTCPCALGLAVPVVQVVATGRLLRRGVLVKAADGLERLAEVDMVVFDKTGTLTLGRPQLADTASLEPADLAVGAALARASRHPLARALAEHVGTMPLPVLTDLHEEPGQGMEGRLGAEVIRLGNRFWVGAVEEAAHSGSELWLKRGGASPVCLRFTDVLRPDAVEVVKALKARGLAVELLSGDREPAVRAAAEELGLSVWHAAARPDAKIERMGILAEEGWKVLMVGDGLNDAPALRAAHVSMSPASAADVSQIAADFVFQGAKLSPLIEALDIARKSRRIVFENFALAIAYNLVAVPLAMAGFVTPLIAAVAMSSSSITVTLNSLRLNRVKEKAGRS
ncbi:MAG: heavy metal translocating P-type ATPase [Parvibaculum sp.]|nr:heavy metal translocating P-type ATPase [Parvibaculum sp.]